jgi:hypothetical protein
VPGAGPLDGAGALEEALQAALDEQRRLKRRVRGWAAAGLVGFAALAVRGFMGLVERAPAPSRIGLVGELVLTTFVVLAASSSLLLALRAEARLSSVREDVLTLMSLRGVTVDRARSAAVLAEHPYRIAPVALSHTAAPLRRRTLSDRARRAGLIGLYAVGAVAAVLGFAWISWPARSAGEDLTWRFLEDVRDPRSLGFETIGERSGVWLLDRLEEATGARALVNHAGAPDERPAMAVLEHVSPRDVRLRTRCKASSDRPEAACGLVFRYASPRTHYVARVDTASATLTLAVVVNHIERTIVARPIEVSAGSWHELAAEARGDRLVVSWNGQRLIEAHDPTLPSPGAVGLWAPSDCVAYFDELTVEPLPSTLPHPSDLLPFLL